MTTIISAPYFNTTSGKRAIYYFTNWGNYGRNYQVTNLPIDKITDISYAFFNIDANGNVFSGDKWADYDNPFIGNGVNPQNKWDSPQTDIGLLGQFGKLLRQGKKINLSLSIGGWSWSKNFSTAISTSTNRQNIVNSLTAIFLKYPKVFNSISIDWEYISDNGINYGLDGNICSTSDPANFILLLNLLKTAFPGFKLALCVSAAPEKVHFPV
jgi:chitinase